jgi:hypothetical protein
MIALCYVSGRALFGPTNAQRRPAVHRMNRPDYWLGKFSKLRVDRARGDPAPEPWQRAKRATDCGGILTCPAFGYRIPLNSSPPRRFGPTCSRNPTPTRYGGTIIFECKFSTQAGLTLVIAEAASEGLERLKDPKFGHSCRPPGHHL